MRDFAFLQSFAAGALTLGLASLPDCVCAADGVQGEVDLLEVHLGKGPNHIVMESTTQFGKGADRFVFKADGGSDTQPNIERFELQALYAHDISGNVTLLAGVRHDFHQEVEMTYGAVGVEATVWSWLAAEHYLFLSGDGDVRGAAQLVATWPLQDRLSLQPRVALGWQIGDIPKEGLSKGVSDGEASVRIRRAIGPASDVYIGFVHQQLLGKTRRVARVAQELTKANILVFGLGFRF